MDNAMSELISHSMRGLKIDYGQASTHLHKGEEDFDQVGQELVKVTCSTFAVLREDEKRSRRSAWLHPAQPTPSPQTGPAKQGLRRRLLFLHCSLMHFSMILSSLLTTGQFPRIFSAFLSFYAPDNLACKRVFEDFKKCREWLKGCVSVILNCYAL